MKNTRRKAVDIIRRDPCAYCGNYQRYAKGHKKAGKIHATVDHIHPRSKGGRDSWGNYTAACQDCNTRKGDNSLLGFLLKTNIPSKDATVLPPFLGTHWYDPLNLNIKRKNLRKRFARVDITG